MNHFGLEYDLPQTPTRFKLKYKELFISIYEEDRDSEKFLKEVHKSLGNLEFTKLKKFISEDSMPNEINKQGFIHILADDTKSEKEVWWGEKRIESKQITNRPEISI